MIEKSFNLRNVSEKWQLWIDLNATTTIKGNQKQLFATNAKESCEECICSSRQYSGNWTKWDPVQRNPIQPSANTRMHKQRAPEFS